MTRFFFSYIRSKMWKLSEQKPKKNVTGNFGINGEKKMIRVEDLIASTTNFILNATEESIVNATAKSPKFPRCPRYTGKTQDAHGFNRAPPYRHLSVPGQSIVTASYAIGIIGNLTALLILHKEKTTKYKNKKHLLMLG